jgi:Holliday junction resolvase RusA-like endonuclease
MSSSSAAVVDLRSDDDGSDNDGSDGDTIQVQEVYRFRIAGIPQAYPRVRVNYGGRFYNPASKKIAAFKAKVKDGLPASANGDIPFKKGTPVTVKIGFLMARPLTDFVGRRRAPGNLKASAMIPRVVPSGSDVDNMAKFVLDALNGVVYHDDTQVVAMEAYKLADDFMDCSGATVVEITGFDIATGIPKFLTI